MNLKKLTKQFVLPSIGIYGAGWLVTLIYFTDWRLITGWIPFYNGKYKGEKKTDDKTC